MFKLVESQIRGDLIKQWSHLKISNTFIINRNLNDFNLELERFRCNSVIHNCLFACLWD